MPVQYLDKFLVELLGICRRIVTELGGEISVSSEVGVAKPDPAIFHLALRLAGCAAHDAVMVGDHPINDIAGAQAAGIEAVMVRNRWFPPPVGVRAVDKLTELRW